MGIDLYPLLWPWFDVGLSTRWVLSPWSRLMRILCHLAAPWWTFQEAFSTKVLKRWVLKTKKNLRDQEGKRVLSSSLWIGGFPRFSYVLWKWIERVLSVGRGQTPVYLPPLHTVYFVWRGQYSVKLVTWSYQELMICCHVMQGLLDFAFSPMFDTNGFFYVSWTVNDTVSDVIRKHLSFLVTKCYILTKVITAWKQITRLLLACWIK